MCYSFICSETDEGKNRYEPIPRHIIDPIPRHIIDPTPRNVSLILTLPPSSYASDDPSFHQPKGRDFPSARQQPFRRRRRRRRQQPIRRIFPAERPLLSRGRIQQSHQQKVFFRLALLIGGGGGGGGG